MDPTLFLTIIVVILISIGIHEYAHAKIADLSGDPTPRLNGRVTLNLFKHLDPLGTIMIVFTALAGFGIGWGRPVPVNPSKMRNPRWDHFWTVAAGPISNLLQAAAYAFLVRLLLLLGYPLGDLWLGTFLSLGILINLSLAFFNLIPLGPLDGQWLLGTFLNERSRLAWTRWNLQYGGIALLAVVLIGQFNPQLSLVGAILRPLVEGSLRVLLG